MISIVWILSVNCSELYPWETVSVHTQPPDSAPATNTSRQPWGLSWPGERPVRRSEDSYLHYSGEERGVWWWGSLMANTSLGWGLGSAAQWRLERGGRPVWNILSPVSSLQHSHTVIANTETPDLLMPYPGISHGHQGQTFENPLGVRLLRLCQSPVSQPGPDILMKHFEKITVLNNSRNSNKELREILMLIS